MGLGDLPKDVSCGSMRESRNPRFSYLFPLVFLFLGLWSWHGEEKKWKLENVGIASAHLLMGQTSEMEENHRLYMNKVIMKLFSYFVEPFGFS